MNTLPPPPHMASGPPRKPSRWPALACGLWLAAMGAAVSQARAADTSAAAATALQVLSAAPAGADTPGTPGEQHITVQKGESIDAVLRRGLPGMPFKDEFMRQALAKANPRIFPKGQTYPVRPGTVLSLPSMAALRGQLLAQSPQAAALFQAFAAPPEVMPMDTGADQRRWVRFP